MPFPEFSFFDMLLTHLIGDFAAALHNVACNLQTTTVQLIMDRKLGKCFRLRPLFHYIFHEIGEMNSFIIVYMHANQVIL